MKKVIGCLFCIAGVAMLSIAWAQSSSPTPTATPIPITDGVLFGSAYNPANFSLSLQAKVPATVWSGCLPLVGKYQPGQQYLVEINYTVCQTNSSSPAGNGHTSACQASIPGSQGIGAQTDIPGDFAEGPGPWTNASPGPYPGACETGYQWLTQVLQSSAFCFGLQDLCSQAGFVPGGNNVSIAVKATPYP